MILNLIIAALALLCLIASNTSKSESGKIILRIIFAVLAFIAIANIMQEFGMFGTKSH